ncbi:trigger factor [uncultured Enorma sp.]|uniref:trigger factor n=1 Tax=uncultured Enorma sp. TaxID=1714346 RepID=UPI0025935652|nr:trigger factor [uncultured Enorma sp.]
MNITASDVENGILTATVTIPAADVDDAIKKAYRDAAKRYNFPGFRRGKAPRPVIDRMLGEGAVLAIATEDAVNAVAPEILEDLDIVPVKDGEFKVDAIVKDHEDFTFSVDYKMRPEPALSSYEPVSIEMPPAEVTDAEIDAQINMLLAYQVKFEDVEDRGVEAEDFVTVDIKDVKNAESLAGEGRAVFVGSGSMPEAVEEGLKGMKAGESKEISWTPEGEDAEEATVEVTVKSIRARITPELTDELAKETFGFDSVEAMRDAVKLEIEQDKQSRLPGIKESRCVAALAERLELEEMDEDYEQSVFQELGQQFLSNLSARGMSLDQWLQANRLTSEQFISDLHHQADDVARESLALDALARELKIEVTDEDIDAEFERAGVEDVEASKASFVTEGRMPAVRDSIRRSKACDWLVENAQVTEVDEVARAAEAEDSEEGASEEAAE